MKKTFTLFFALAVCCIFCLPQTIWAYEYQGPEAELIALINKERVKNGSEPLTINWEVARLARYKSEEMKRHGLFSHESLVYGSPAQTLERFQVPFDLVGSNIAMGHETAAAVLEAWRNSQNHYTNIIRPDYTSAGAGLSIDDDGISYWTLLLIQSKHCPDILREQPNQGQ